MKRYSENKSDLSYDVLTNAKNLNYLDTKQTVLFETRLAMIRELAYSICNGGAATTDEIKENYFSVHASDDFECGSSSFEIKNFFYTLSIAEKVYLCREIITYIAGKSSFYETVIGSAEPCPSAAKGKICYIKNNFTDSAYSFFSKSVKSSSRAFSDTFEAICEGIQSGEFELGILPIETSSDGKLLAFYSMIDRYGLKIVSTCSIDHADSQKFTKFALVGKSIKIPSANQSKYCIELRIVQSSRDQSSLYDILCAARTCDISVARVDSLRLPYGDSLFSHYAVLDLSESNLDAFLAYVALEFPQCYALGIYHKN